MLTGVLLYSKRCTGGSIDQHRLYSTAKIVGIALIANRGRNRDGTACCYSMAAYMKRIEQYHVRIVHYVHYGIVDIAATVCNGSPGSSAGGAICYTDAMVGYRYHQVRCRSAAECKCSAGGAGTDGLTADSGHCT